MKFTRRTFLSMMSAATAWALSPFKALAGKKQPTPDITKTVVKPHKSVCYVYNPGIDLTGVGQLTFNQTNVIKGGVITRIESAEEWISQCLVDFEEDITPEEFLGLYRKNNNKALGISKNKRTKIGDEYYQKGLYRVEKIKTGSYIDHDDGERHDLMEDRYVIVHPAQEIVDNLLHICGTASFPLVIIWEWNDRLVDLKSINDHLGGITIKQRIDAVHKLPVASWRMSSVLKKNLLPALRASEELAEFLIARKLETMSLGLSGYGDQHSIALFKLTGRTFNASQVEVKIDKEATQKYIDRYKTYLDNPSEDARKEFSDRVRRRLGI